MKLLRTMLVAAGIALLAFAARADSKSEGFGELTPDQVSALIASKGADIYDNNDQKEFKEGHVPTAKWVKFNDVKESDLPADHARKLVFYCHNTH
jgi:rhodanese-related sulfurtransferase